MGEIKERVDRKLRCPRCNKEIDQAEVRIPLFVKQALDLVGPAATYGNLVYKNGKYHLVFGTTAICPHCKNNFSYDIWLPTENQE